MKPNKFILTVFFFSLFFSSFFVTTTFALSSEKNETESKYDNFPEQSGFIEWAGDFTGLGAEPENLITRNDRATKALEDSLKEIDGKGLNFLITKSECVAWINLYRGSVVGGLKGGRGMASCRINSDSKTKNKVNSWSAPVFINMGNLSAGFQIGIDQSDYFLFFSSKEAFTNTLKGNMTLSGNAALSIPQSGRSASIGLDVDLKEMEIEKDFIYSYAIGHGAYAGLSLEGGFIIASKDYNFTAYKETATLKILDIPSSEAPKGIRTFSNKLEEMTNKN